MIQGKRIRKNLKSQLLLEANRLFQVLKKKKMKLVLAESCTGGMVASTMTGFPGISDYFCGSSVTYRDASKAKWLGVNSAHLKEFGAVNQRIAIQMAEGALKNTPEADLAASITGHLGPGAPKTKDGKLFMAVAIRGTNRKNRPFVFVNDHHLQDKSSKRVRHAPSQNRTRQGQKQERVQRLERQVSASHSLLLMVRSLLEYTGHEGE